MRKVYDTSKDLLFWNKPFLIIGGMWPLQTNSVIFYIWLIFCTVHLCLMIIDLVQIMDNLAVVVGNLCATAPLMMIMAKMLVLHYSTLLRTLMRKVARNENEVDYKNEEEREIYVSYTKTGLRFFKILLIITLSATTLFYFKSLKLDFERAVLEGFTGYPLAYRAYIFFNISNNKEYLLAYACQGPLIYVYTCQTSIALFVWSLLIDVCGQLSVLAFRIKNTKCNPLEADDRLISVFRDIIQKHKNIIWNSKAIDGAFNIALLVEIFFCTVIMGLCMYNMIVNSSLSDVTEFLSFFLYIFMMMLVMYGYCLAGDILVRESLNVRDSYFECDWYNMSPRCKKVVIICMIQTRIPLQLTGGGFYIYSVESFTGVCKTAMAYGSMLRQLV